MNIDHTEIEKNLETIDELEIRVSMKEKLIEFTRKEIRELERTIIKLGKIPQ